MEDEIELYKRAGALEQQKATVKETVRHAREQSQIDMAGMRETAMAALYSLMVHDDPGVRLKAVTLWANKMVPSIAAEKAEDDKDIIEAGAGFDDIARQIEELKKKAL